MCAQLLASGSKHMRSGNLHKAAKAFQKAISAKPTDSAPYHNLAVVMSRSNKRPEACQYAIMAADVALKEVPDGKPHERWAKSWGVACALLYKPSCEEVPRPPWWTDTELLRLSKLAVELIPKEKEVDIHQTRALVLSEGVKRGTCPRTAAQIREAAKCLRRQAKLIPYMAAACNQNAAALDQRATMMEGLLALMAGMKKL